MAIANAIEQDNRIQPVKFSTENTGTACEGAQAVAKEQPIHVHFVVQWAQWAHYSNGFIVHANINMLCQNILNLTLFSSSHDTPSPSVELCQLKNCTFCGKENCTYKSPKIISNLHNLLLKFYLFKWPKFQVLSSFCALFQHSKVLILFFFIFWCFIFHERNENEKKNSGKKFPTKIVSQFVAGSRHSEKEKKKCFLCT